MFLFQIEDLQSQIKYLNESIQVTQGTFETVSAKLSLMASLLIKLMCSISLGFQSVGAIEPIAPTLTRPLLWATWMLIMIWYWKKRRKKWLTMVQVILINKFHKSCLFIFYCFFIRKNLLGSKVLENCWRMVSMNAFFVIVVQHSNHHYREESENQNRIYLFRAWYFDFL